MRIKNDVAVVQSVHTHTKEFLQQAVLLYFSEKGAFIYLALTPEVQFAHYLTLWRVCVRRTIVYIGRATQCIWQDFRKIFTELNMLVLIFSTIFVRNILHSKKSSARYYHKHT
jgi:hypothetical protein